MAMASHRQLALSALVLASTARATQWSVTSYYAVKPTTEVDIYTDDYYTDVYTYTQEYTGNFVVKDGVTPTAAATLSATTYTDSYYDIEMVEIYLDGDDVAADELQPTTTTDDDYYGSYDYATTYYYQNIEYTAPTSCPTAFTVTTSTNIIIPSAVRNQITPTSITTYIATQDDGGKYTYVTAFLDSDAVPVSINTASDYYYSYYVADCRDPNGGSYGGSRYNDDDDDDHRSGWDYCMGDSYCSGMAIYVIVIAALIPALFLLGFLESYFWFRRMMLGKFALRFGTLLWILLILPVLCFTRNCPARDADTQKALLEQWKKVSFGKALGLWFKWGFRHRYPVELLGAHPMYHNPPPAQQQQQMFQVPPGPPAPGGYVYYTPGPPGPDGQPTFQPMPPPPEGYKGAPPNMQQQQMGSVPPGMVMYYPQYPPQAHAPPPQHQQQQQPMSPGSVSPEASQAPSVAGQPSVSPPPPTNHPAGEVYTQPEPESHAGPSNAGPSHAGPSNAGPSQPPAVANPNQQGGPSS